MSAPGPSAPAAPEAQPPTDPIRTLLIGAPADIFREQRAKLRERAGLSLEWHWTTEMKGHLPAGCEFVLMFTDFVSHQLSEEVPYLCKGLVPFVRCPSTWAKAKPHIEREVAKVVAVRGSQARLTVQADANAKVEPEGREHPTVQDIAKILGADTTVVLDALTLLLTQGRIPIQGGVPPGAAPGATPLLWTNLHQYIPMIELAVLEALDTLDKAPAAEAFEEAPEPSSKPLEPPMPAPVLPPPVLPPITSFESDSRRLDPATVKLQLKVLAEQIQDLLRNVQNIREIRINAESIKAEIIKVETVSL
jgi:hypothetical protein